MKAAALTLALTSLALLSSAAGAQEIPRYDIEANCRLRPELLAQDGKPYEACVADETSARRELTPVWEAAIRENRQTCSEDQTEPPQSYVELLVCLQMYGGPTPPALPPRRLRARQR